MTLYLYLSLTTIILHSNNPSPSTLLPFFLNYFHLIVSFTFFFSSSSPLRLVFVSDLEWLFKKVDTKEEEKAKMNRKAVVQFDVSKSRLKVFCVVFF
uniref:Uncharacterized protein n=1 Tax=Solanum lycopersicum TaxID=4081 RepID=K4CPI2_SOLLC